MDAAVKQVGGNVTNRDAVIAAITKADYASVRGEFSYGANHYPIQDYYLRVVEKDSSGRMTNILKSTVLDNHQDAYVAECKMS